MVEAIASRVFAEMAEIPSSNVSRGTVMPSVGDSARTGALVGADLGNGLVLIGRVCPGFGLMPKSLGLLACLWLYGSHSAVCFSSRYNCA